MVRVHHECLGAFIERQEREEAAADAGSEVGQVHPSGPLPSPSPVTSAAAAPPPPGSGNGLAAGLPHHIVIKVAAAYVEVAEEATAVACRRSNGGTSVDLRSLEAVIRRSLDAGLRQRLAEMVQPEYVEVTFEQVMAEVYRT
jgi:hypothetical protein